MKDEIKEILEDNGELMVRYKDNSFECFDTLPKNVIDYITNLQEGIESQSKAQVILDDENAELQGKIMKLQEENERLKKLKERYQLEKEIYKTRNEKAVDYINENKHLSMFADCREPKEDWNYDLEINPRDLLNILQGKSDE